MTPLCQITRNGGCPSRTADQIWKSPTGCAILKSQISTSPHQKVRRIPVFQSGHSLPLFPLPLPLSLEGFPKGRNRSFAPLCRFKGVRGEIEIPPRFSLGGRGGHSLFKREYPPGFSVPNRYSSAGNPGNLFGKTKRKWGFNPVRHSRTSPYQSGAFDVSKENVGCILRGKAALPAANRRLSTDRPGSAAYSCTGGRPGPGSARRWGWRGCGCPPPPRSGW